MASAGSEYPVREQIAKDIRALIVPCLDIGVHRADPQNCVGCARNEALEQAAKLAEKVPHRDSWVRPDWVMVGVPNDTAGVMVLASTELTAAEFIRETVGLDSVPVRKGMRLARIPRVRSTLLAEIGAFQTSYAADYPSALRDLLSRAGWAKPADERRYPLASAEEISEAQRALGPPPSE